MPEDGKELPCGHLDAPRLRVLNRVLDAPAQAGHGSCSSVAPEEAEPMILRVLLYFVLMSGLTLREWLVPVRTR